MKVFLDDIRETPEGWIRTFTVKETVILLKTREVSHISLDSDLGEDQPGGYKVLDAIEEMVYDDETFPLPEITVHSSNAARVEYMQRAIQSIHRIRQQQLEVGNE